MINIYNNIEELECTAYHAKSEELRDLINDEVDRFIGGLSEGITEEWMSDCHIVFVDEEGTEDEDIESELSNILDDIYSDFFIECEEEDEDEDEE